MRTQIFFKGITLHQAVSLKKPGSEEIVILYKTTAESIIKENGIDGHILIETDIREPALCCDVLSAFEHIIESENPSFNFNAYISNATMEQAAELSKFDFFSAEKLDEKHLVCGATSIIWTYNMGSEKCAEIIKFIRIIKDSIVSE